MLIPPHSHRSIDKYHRLSLVGQAVAVAFTLGFSGHSMAVEHIESDPFHLQTTESNGLILGEFYNENSYIYQNTFNIEQERTSYGTSEFFASTLYLKTNSLKGTTATFEKDVSLLHTYHKYTGSSMNATVIRLRDGSSA